MRSLLSFFVLLAIVLMSGRARAEQVDLKAAVDADVVELGDTVMYQFNVSVRGGAPPSDPQPGNHPGFDVVGTSSAPVHMNMSVNGQRSSLDTLVTSWSLRANRLGSFTLGPANVQVGGARRTATAVHVKVVPRGQGQKKKPQAFDPFAASPLDPFKGLFDLGDDAPPQRVEPTADPKLGLEQPRAPIAFLHAVVDKSRAVIGEQVTSTVYLYQDPYAHPGQPADVHEATATDFAKKSLLEGDMRAIPVGTAMVGGRLWSIAIVRKDALFPLKGGHLPIEPMSLTLPQARAGLRESERLFVDVTEPPAAGRPPGYALGDVGDMSLSATVTPRTIDQGGAVGVTLELRGTGNLPAALSLPIADKVEWLESQSKENMKAVTNERYGGTRTFSYVVRVHKSGTVDLGEVRLPYYDPDRKTYETARAAIGIVEVSKGSERAPTTDDPDPILPDLPKPRAVLEGTRTETFLSERPIYWGFLFGSPFACVLGLGGAGLARKVREKRAASAPSPERIAKERRAEADTACKGEDGKAAMGAIARAIEATILEHTNVNVRGGDSATMSRELEDAGISAERTKAIVDQLRACEDARFSPEGVSIASARETWTKAKTALDDLRSAKP